LHDTIEDTETTLEELQQEFGPRIAGIDICFFLMRIKIWIL